MQKAEGLEAKDPVNQEPVGGGCIELYLIREVLSVRVSE